MCLAAIYRDLQGSFGQVHLQLPQAFLDDVCRLFEHEELTYAGKIRKILIAPDKRKQNRLRIKIELSRDFWQDIGGMLLNTFGDDGLEIQIDQTFATPTDRSIQVSFETRTPGINLAQILVKEINNALNSPKVIEMKTEGAWWDLWNPYTASLTLDPYLLLKGLIDVFPSLRGQLPPAMVDHLSRIELTTSGGCLNVDLAWKHLG